MKNKILFGTFIFQALLFLFSCSKKTQIQEIETISKEKKNHTWYYFSNGSFYKTSNIENVPKTIFKPWTESARISSASCQSEEISSLINENEVPKGFALVNRTGLLVFTGSDIKLYEEPSIFSSSTTEQLVFFNHTPIFLSYRSNFFNEDLFKNQALLPFLIQFNYEQNVFYPVLNVQNLNLKEKAQITDFVWDGQFWTCSVKDSSNEKIEFSYLTFQPKEAITSITPLTAQNTVFCQDSTQEEFRKSKQIENIKKAPERIKTLLNSVSDNVDFSVTVNTASGHSPRTYIHAKENTDSPVITSNAILARSWAACLFEDGSFFLKGSLFSKSILNHGKTVGIKLPKLPLGFSYSAFTISGSTLYAAWEEKAFYTTARSGFIAVNLDEVLYKNESIR